MNYIGGPVGSNGRRVIENADLRSGGFNPGRTSNTDYYKCRLPEYYGSVADNVRLLECVHKNLTVPARGEQGSHVLYINNGHKENEIGLVIQGHRFIRCTAANLMEFKASDVTVADCQQKDCGTQQTIRFRHGRKHIVIGNWGFGEISCRGWLSWIVDNPSAHVKLWAGNLPARHVAWGPLKEAGKGNYQTCELAYVEGCGSVKMGHVQGSINEFPALNCLIDLGQRDVTEEATEFTLRSPPNTGAIQSPLQHLDSFDGLEAKL
jgi:hypothetical protein